MDNGVPIAPTVPCPPRTPPNFKVAATFAAIVLIAIILIYMLYERAHKKKQDRFASNQARVVTVRAREVFADKDASYTKYRASVPSADPVQYNDVRRLWREGQLTPEHVQDIL